MFHKVMLLGVGRAGLCLPAGPWDGERKWDWLVFLLVLCPSLPCLPRTSPGLSLSGHFPPLLIQQGDTSKISFCAWQVGLPMCFLACLACKYVQRLRDS